MKEYKGMAKDKYLPTVTACCIGIVVQAIIVNYAPLLFVTFQKTYKMPLREISFLIFLSFFIQLLIDATSVLYVERLGLKKCAVIAQAFSFVGLVSLGILPDIITNFRTALLISAVLYSVGGGLIEIVGSPIVESCPSANKSTRMSFLHSFYAWGQVGTIAVSTIVFAVFGIDKWKIFAIILSTVPLINVFIYLKAPMPPAEGINSGKGNLGKLLKNRIFLLFILAMICAGASEQVMAQWASAFAETALGVEKTVGDILGPCLFAIFLGMARSLHAGYKGKIKLSYLLAGCGALCVLTFLVASLSSSPVVGLFGCAFSGLAIGIMWPGVLSLSAEKIKGGPVMFSLLALGGDIGCMSGPAAAGLIAGAANGSLKAGFLGTTVFAVVFTLIMLKHKT